MRYSSLVKILLFLIITALCASSATACNVNPGQSTRTPNADYATEKGLSSYIEYIEPFGQDGKMDESEKARIDTIYAVLPAIQDFPEEGINDTVAALAQYRDFADACNKLSAFSNKAVRTMMVFRMDETCYHYVDFVSSLPDKEWSTYVLENKLCIQDKQLTEIEEAFLKEPDTYLQQLFDVYRADMNSMNSDVTGELLALPDFKLKDFKRLEAFEDILGLMYHLTVKRFSIASWQPGEMARAYYGRRGSCSPGERMTVNSMKTTGTL
jgi:hypothetical protein